MITWLLSKWREIVVIALIVVIAIQTKRMNLIKEHDATSQTTIDQQAKDIKMLKNELAHIQIIGNRVIYLTRTVAGGAIAGHNEPYKPPEGHVDIVFTSTTGGQPHIIVTVQNKGFTFKPGLGALYSLELNPELDVKWGFWDRYSIKTGITPKFVNVGLSRHIDDLIPFLDLQNVEIQGVFGKTFKWENRLGIGLRSNL